MPSLGFDCCPDSPPAHENSDDRDNNTFATDAPVSAERPIRSLDSDPVTWSDLIKVQKDFNAKFLQLQEQILQSTANLTHAVPADAIQGPLGTMESAETAAPADHAEDADQEGFAKVTEPVQAMEEADPPAAQKKKESEITEDSTQDAALLPGQSGIALRAAMRRAANNMSVHDCASVEPYCYYYHNSGPLKTASMLARTLCPRTCGCTSLTSGTLVIGGNTNFLGCPSACDRYRGWDFAVQLVDTCEDMEGTSSTSWSVWMQEAAHVVGESDETIHMLRQDGCSANVFKTSTRDDLCLGAGIWQMMKPLLYVCPEACGCCDEGDKGRNWNRDPRCPPACQQCNNTSL